MGRDRRTGFSLIEALVVVAILAVLLGVLLPTLSSVRETTRHVRCLANLRSMGAAWRLHATDNDDQTPALGVPWAEAPNWSIIVARASGRTTSTASDLRSDDQSVLVCPTTQRQYPTVAMTRTYAANVTGYAGAPGDRGDFDAEPTFVRFSQVASPAGTPMLLDSAPILPGPDLPPPSRTASVIDFRDEGHVDGRIGRIHGDSPNGGHFQVVFYDGAASRHDEVRPNWASPIAP
ncbi:MAG: type II secretion system protein [Phycisphaerales bacterium]